MHPAPVPVGDDGVLTGCSLAGLGISIPEPLIQLMTDEGKEAWPRVKAVLAA
jgi:hypothetical protein